MTPTRTRPLASIALLVPACALLFAACGDGGANGAGAGDAGAPSPESGSPANDDGGGGPEAAAGEGGGGGDGGAADAGADADGEAGAPPTCTLTSSPPLVITQAGATVANLKIVADGAPAIEIRANDVVVRNVAIAHKNGVGILVNGASGVTLENVDVSFAGAPAKGPNPSSDDVNIVVQSSPNVTITNARLAHGSTGIYLLSSPGSQLSTIAGTDFRGPFPRGQLVQWDKSSNATLQHFSVVNDGEISWTEDNVNVYQSTNVTIRDGLVDGNNSPSGVGVIFDGDTSSGLVEDVDAVHMGNGCFSAIAGIDGNVFRQTRCRDNICTSQQGRGVPSSNALMWCGHTGYTQLRIEASLYFNACNPGNIVWPAASFAVADVTAQNFTPKPPILNAFCWQ